MRGVLLLTAALMLGVSCGGGKPKGQAGGSAVGIEAPAADKFTPYAMPSIPAMITRPEDQADWVAHHYWDNFEFADTTKVAGWSDYAEQAFVDYSYGLLPNISPELADESIGVLFGKAAANKDIFWNMAEIAEKYLYDPNSPYRNEDRYIAVLNAVLANPSNDQYERIRPEGQLKLALKNRVGESAADFRYTLASGASGTLRGLTAPYTLLFFNNPGCPACRQTQTEIVGSQFLGRLIDEGTLKVLALYPDEDLTAWREHAPEMPEEWINSYDKERSIKTDELYDLKAIPTLYLLDGDKRVLLKDVMSIPLIEETIYNTRQ